LGIQNLIQDVLELSLILLRTFDFEDLMVWLTTSLISPLFATIRSFLLNGLLSHCVKILRIFD